MFGFRADPWVVIAGRPKLSHLVEADGLQLQTATPIAENNDEKTIFDGCLQAAR